MPRCLIWTRKWTDIGRHPYGYENSIIVGLVCVQLPVGGYEENIITFVGGYEESV